MKDGLLSVDGVQVNEDTPLSADEFGTKRRVGALGGRAHCAPSVRTGESVGAGLATSGDSGGGGDGCDNGDVAWRRCRDDEELTEAAQCLAARAVRLMPSLLAFDGSSCMDDSVANAKTTKNVTGKTKRRSSQLHFLRLLPPLPLLPLPLPLLLLPVSHHSRSASMALRRWRREPAGGRLSVPPPRARTMCTNPDLTKTEKSQSKLAKCMLLHNHGLGKNRSSPP